MKPHLLFAIVTVFIFAACHSGKQATGNASKPYVVMEESLALYDTARSRSITVEVYYPKTNTTIKEEQFVIINHGYDANRGGSNKTYSYIANHLAAKGYYVASIQHELPTDSLIPSEGIPQIVRRSNWERGVANILFVLNSFKQSHPGLDYKHVILIGHSNGGDMSMLFAQKYPALVDKVISLDNRRVALPRTKHPHIYSIRSSDQPADEGVLPTAEEQKLYDIKIVKLPNTIHNDMGGNGTDAQKSEINGYIDQYLND